MKSNLKIIFLFLLLVLSCVTFSQKDSYGKFSTIYIARTEQEGVGIESNITIENQPSFVLNTNEVVEFKIYSEGKISLFAFFKGDKSKLKCNLRVKNGNNYYVFLDRKVFFETQEVEVESFKAFIYKKEKTIKKEEALDNPIYAHTIDSTIKKEHQNNNYQLKKDKDSSYAIINFIRKSYLGFDRTCFISFPNQIDFGLPVGVLKYKVYSEGVVAISANYPGLSTLYCVIKVKRGQEYFIKLERLNFKEVSFEKVAEDLALSTPILKEENIDYPINKASLASIHKIVGQGTCFLISKEGYFITNYHCIEGAEEISIKGINGDFNTKYNAEVIASDPSNDLALLKIINTNVKLNLVPYGLRTTGVEQAEKVYALGFPKASSMGQEIKITDGIISSKSGAKGDISKFQISAAVNPGNSGGPLIDENGNIIGVICSKSTIAESASYAIKASNLEVFLKNIDGFSFPTFINTIKDKTLTEKIKEIKQFIFILESK